MKKIIGFFVLGIAILSMLLVNPCMANSEKGIPYVDPRVDIVSIGPISHKVAFKLIVFVDEVYYHLRIQKIVYGPESCCPKVISSYSIEDKDIGGAFSVKSVDKVQWKSSNKLYVLINERMRYMIKLSTNDYKIKFFTKD